MRQIHPILKLSVLVVAALLAQGCAANRQYAWGRYDTTLYRHYKAPQDREKFVANLKEIIEEGEKENKVPPGVYAEYGYALLEEGRIDEAATYFGKEKAKWPECGAFMDKMIRNCDRMKEARKSSSTTAPPAAAGASTAGQENR